MGEDDSRSFYPYTYMLAFLSLVLVNIVCLHQKLAAFHRYCCLNLFTRPVSRSPAKVSNILCHELKFQLSEAISAYSVPGILLQPNFHDEFFAQMRCTSTTDDRARGRSRDLHQHIESWWYLSSFASNSSLACL